MITTPDQNALHSALCCHWTEVRGVALARGYHFLNEKRAGFLFLLSSRKQRTKWPQILAKEAQGIPKS